MRTAKYRQIIVALLLVAFSGQAVATMSMVCLNSADPIPSHEQMMDSGAMDHSQHVSTETVLLGDTVAVDCCPDCDCSLSGCSAVALPSTPSISSALHLRSITGLYDESADFQLAVALFRPPISR